MGIDETVDWSAVPEDLLLSMVPEDDPEYGGSRVLRLMNAKRIYAYARLSEALRDVDDNHIVLRLQQGPDSFDTFCALARMMYEGKEQKDVDRLIDTDFDSWLGK